MITLDELINIDNLSSAINNKYVRVQTHPQDFDLKIYNYTEKTVWEKKWDDVTEQCRGLIVKNNLVIARPWRKFFNYSERPDVIAVDEAVEVTDKKDGSMGVLYLGPEGFAVATRGSFASDQAVHATKILLSKYLQEAESAYKAGLTVNVNKNKIYSPDENLPQAFIVDVDGTLLKRLENGRSPYDWHRVLEDVPNVPVVEIVTSLQKDYEIVVLSGRDEICEKDTRKSLFNAGIRVDQLYMRKNNDNRSDVIVKDELFWEHVAPAYNVRGVIDDRKSVTKLWRDLGLMCAQVDYGDF